MRLTDTAGTYYNLHFLYGEHEGKRTTACTLHLAPCLQKSRPCLTKPDGLGFAVCNPPDEFRKSTGRKIVLSRAMRDLGLTRGIRAELWLSYLAQVGRD